MVGSREIREVESGFPGVGTAFHHSVALGPLRISDHTRVEESVPPRLLRLRARTRPVGTAMVTLELHAESGGTRVVMTEDAADPLTALVFNPLTHLLVRGRNAESLRRLRDLVEGRGPSMTEAAAA